MPSDSPAEWAITHARHIYLYGECKCDAAGPCDMHSDIATELDAAHAAGFAAGIEAAATVAVQGIVCFGEDFQIARKDMQFDYHRRGLHGEANALGRLHARMQGIIEDRAADVAAEIRKLQPPVKS